MFKAKLLFFQQSIPKAAVNEYLKDTFEYSLPESNQSSVSLFLSYHQDPIPPSYQGALEKFPFICKLFSSAYMPCFIVVCNLQELISLWNWAQQHSCQKLAEDLIESQQEPQQVNFHVRDKVYSPEIPVLMGIMNITPDSFYDGGKFFDVKDYGEAAAKLIEEGADIIDIGGESTRPGSKPVNAEDEISRVLPAVEQIRSRFHIPISVDTVKPKVAEAVLMKGADMINDTSAFAAGEGLLNIVKKFNASYCLMHIQGTPENMQQNPEYQDLLLEIYDSFAEKLDICAEIGLRKEKVCIDPGIGFGKQFNHNMHLLRFLSVFRQLNHPILLGTSNKSFIGKALDREVDDRLSGTIATQIFGLLKGANIFRVHDVKSNYDSLKMAMYYIT